MTELNTESCKTTVQNEYDINLVLRKLGLSYPNNVIIGHLNINSIRNKFEMLQFLLADYTDIFISESKLDGTFPSSQFQIFDFRTPYRLDRNDRGERILLSRHSFTHDIEILFTKLKFRKRVANLLLL